MFLLILNKYKKISILVCFLFYFLMSCDANYQSEKDCRSREAERAATLIVMAETIKMRRQARGLSSENTDIISLWLLNDLYHNCDDAKNYKGIENGFGLLEE